MKRIKNNSTMDLADWIIIIHVNIALLALITLAFLHPTAAVVGAVCAAVPTILGTYHFFFVRDQKIPDAHGHEEIVPLPPPPAS